MRQLKPLAAAAAALVIAGMIVLAGPIGPATAASCTGRNVSDFNGDGISDVAIGEAGANRFHVIYGHGTHLNATTPQDQLFAGPSGSEGYGIRLVSGDFNADGCTDLAVAYTGDIVNGSIGHGRVAIYLGSPSGLTSAGVTLIPADTEIGDEFGDALGAGDVNNDGKDDLVVGAPGHNAVYVFLGSSTGVKTTGSEYLDGHGGVPGSNGALDFFGAAIAVADFNGDSHADVAIGAPGENSGSGRVDVLRGNSTAAPLSTSGIQIWSQDSAGVPGVAEKGDAFGSALAAGNFKGNGRFDLAVGVPDETLPQAVDAGIVDILFSAGSTGLSGTGAQGWSQATAGVPGTPGINEEFGATLVSADFNGDSKDDLAVGQPDGTVGADQNSAGAVTVFYGEASGLDGSGIQRFTQDTSGIAGTAEANDNFGYSLAVVRVTHDAEYDLVVGVPGEGLGSTQEAGVMQLIPGSSAGLTATGSELWSDGTAGVKGSAQFAGGFGTAVA